MESKKIILFLCVLLNIPMIVFIIRSIYVGFQPGSMRCENDTEQVKDHFLDYDLSELVEIKDSVQYYINAYNIRYSSIVLAQAELETGHFTSTVFRNNNNLFGMRTVYNRPTTQIGSCSSGYGIYASLEMSIIDYALWQAWSAKGLNENEYLELLERIYAEDSNYIIKIKRLWNR